VAHYAADLTRSVSVDACVGEPNLMTDTTPLFTIVVPTFGRPRQLAACLHGIAEMTYPRERYEVIVVDDGSRERPSSVVSDFVNRIQVRLIAQTHAGPAAARNTGARQARGKYLVFTDDDCTFAPDYLQVVERHVKRSPRAGLGGHTDNRLGGDIYAEATQQLIEHLYTHFNANPNAPRFFTTTNLVVPRDRFDRVGGFDSSFPLAGAEDRDFCERWKAAGYELSYAADAVVHHSHSLTLRSFLRQHFNYGRGRYFLLRSRARRGVARPALEPLRFYTSLLLSPYNKQPRPRPLLLSLLLVLTQVSYASGYLSERVRRGPRKRPERPQPATPPRIRKRRSSRHFDTV
jgi:GT2 family glycosyltransferase